MDQAGEFLAALDTTPMTRSYKMLVLMAMLNRDAVPGKISIGELAEEFGRIARRSARLRQDVGEALDNADRLRRLIERDPIIAWVGGKGTGGRSHFRYQDNELEFTGSVSDETREGFQELARELVDWRLAEYLARYPGPERSEPGAVRGSPVADGAAHATHLGERLCFVRR